MNRDFNQNKLYRMGIFFPIMAFRVLRKFVYQFSDDAKFIKSLKDTKKGKNCFIIGNGPSLTVKDLEDIASFDTFATNRIYSIFKETKWRPTYYLAIDNNILDDNLDNIIKAEAGLKLLNYTTKKAVSGKVGSNTKFINIFGRYVLNPASYETKTINYDVSKSFSLSYSVTGVAIELAVYMGYKNIYLIGVDHSYSNAITKDGVLKKTEGIKDYFGDLKSKSYSIQYIDAVNSYYVALDRHAKEHGSKVYNATRGGKLEIFARKDLDEVMRDIDG